MTSPGGTRVRPLGWLWAGLVAATALQWALGEDDLGLPARATGVVLLVVAGVKVTLVGERFMELAHAPRPLRLAFAGYCWVLVALLAGLFLAA